MSQPRTRITRELDRRTGDGIEVRLLWCQNDGHVTVGVTDTKALDITSRSGAGPTPKPSETLSASR